MFDFLDLIDLEQPHFYLQPSTRCLKCEQPLMPAEERDGRNFWRCGTWKCREYANVGLGAKNQVTQKIVWSERHEEASSHGTSLDFVGVKPPFIIYGIYDGDGGWMDEDENGFDSSVEPFIERYKPPVPMPPCDEGFTSLLAAILFFRKHHNPNEIRVAESSSSWSGELLSSAHDLMETLLSDPASREFQISSVLVDRT